MEQSASVCTWIRFEAGSGWFPHDLADYGIAAPTPDGRRLAVPAATDTD